MLGQGHAVSNWESWLPVLVMLFTSCATLAKSINFSEPQFSPTRWETT